MQKTEFLDRLRTALADLPAEELEKTLGYYAEMIEDRMEDGMDEEAAVAAMGDRRRLRAKSCSTRRWGRWSGPRSSRSAR